MRTSTGLGGLALIAVLLASAGCPTAPPPAGPAARAPAKPAATKSFVFRDAPWRAPEAPICKPQASVAIDAIAWTDSATVQITFLTAATSVHVTLWGTDGLAVTSNAAPVVNENFAANATIEIPVTYAPLPEESCLAVRVEGAFGSPMRGSRVVSFNVPGTSGKKNVGEARSPGKLGVDSEGNRIIDMPATQVK